MAWLFGLVLLSSDVARAGFVVMVLVTLVRKYRWQLAIGVAGYLAKVNDAPLCLNFSFRIAQVENLSYALNEVP